LQVVVNVITTWLWAEHADHFQNAFAKSGRIDVDRQCKWLIYAAADATVYKFTEEINARGTVRLRDGIGDYGVASLVGAALTKEIFLDHQTDSALPNYQLFLHMLHDRRIAALKSQCRERVLLANLLARTIRISDYFANAYVSAIIRAGEALGHEELCEIVQDEDSKTSSLLPYDILSDHTGAWEDPCRPSQGFLRAKSHEHLLRAHARATIQKSLHKLQEKFDIKGGVHHPGPYAEQLEDVADPVLTPSKPNVLKRRNLFSFETGLSSSTAQTLLHSAPLHLDLHDVQNMPYGFHVVGKKAKKFSRYAFHHDSPNKKQRTNPVSNHSKAPLLLNTTEPINWTDLAKCFQPSSTPGAKAISQRPPPNNIFAPFFRRLDSSPSSADARWFQQDSDSDASDQEDISDEIVLTRHQRVLDQMKEKLDLAMETEQKTRRDK